MTVCYYVLMKKQVVVIHGGVTFDTYEEYLEFLRTCEISLESLSKKDWKDSLELVLNDFEVIAPKMPNKMNAKYSEWKIWFAKIALLLNDDVTLIGHSLGGIFLTKYLSENDFPFKISSLHLVAAPYNVEGLNESLSDFELEHDVSSISEKVKNIFLYQSKDDKVVPFSNVVKYKNDLPNAELVIFDDRGHFKQNEFPEIIRNINFFHVKDTFWKVQ